MAEDLAVSLAQGVPWLDFRISRKHRVALIGREDNPGLTRWRIRSLTRGKGYKVDDLGDRLYINTREQTAKFLLDDGSHLSTMISALSEVHPEIAIFDVFNVLHHANENDNTEMRTVLESLSAIQREVGCSIGVVHHFNKLSEGTMTQRLRGSSAIAGWAEWLIGLDTPEKEMRRVQFELKAASAPEPRWVSIQSEAGASWVRTCEPPSSAKGRRKPQDILQ